MSERARDLLDTIQSVMDAEAKWGDIEPTNFARSICEHLGITWDMVGLLEDRVSVTMRDTARALATLLEAARIER